jgi:hypothetical protein
MDTTLSSSADSPDVLRPSINSLNEGTLELILYFAGLSHIKLWITHPDYKTLKACSLVSQAWRRPAQSLLYRHIRINTPASMLAIRSRESRRLIEEFKTEYLDSENQWGMDSYWLLDRVGGKGSLKGFSLTYDPMRGDPDGQAERDEEWLEWEILRHPALTGMFHLLSFDSLLRSARAHEVSDVQVSRVSAVKPTSRIPLILRQSSSLSLS